jgi:putative transposase
MMQKIDAEHLDHPAKGVVGMTDFLLEEGYKVGLRKVRRMMRLMGIMPVCYRNQVWCIDITYIPMKKGFMYLTAIIDVYSRFIVGWSLHNSLDASHCIEVLQNAMRPMAHLRSLTQTRVVSSLARHGLMPGLSTLR